MGVTTTEEPAGAQSWRNRPRGAYAKSGEKRAAILDAAVEVFAQAGFRSGSMREVAERVGISEPGLIHHYPNKTSLLQAVLQRRDLHWYEFVPGDLVDGEASVRGLITLAQENQSTPGVVQLYCTLAAEATSPDHPAHDYFVHRYERARAVLEAAFGQLGEVGKLADDVTPQSAARETIAMMDGLQVQWLLDRSTLDMADELRRFLRKQTRLSL